MLSSPIYPIKTQLCLWSQVNLSHVQGSLIIGIGIGTFIIYMLFTTGFSSILLRNTGIGGFAVVSTGVARNNIYFARDEIFAGYSEKFWVGHPYRP
jgi:hypothetical protein